MSDQEHKNPFSSLIPPAEDNEVLKSGVIQPETVDSSADACGSKTDVEMQAEDETAAVDAKERHAVSHFYEEVFRFTLSKDACCNRNGCASLVFLNEVHVAMNNQKELDENCLDRAVFARLLLGDPTHHLVHRREPDKNEEEGDKSSQKSVMFYLYQSYQRLKTHSFKKVGPCATAQQVIVSQTAMALGNPDMFPDSKLAEDLMKLFLQYSDHYDHCEILPQFLCDVSQSIVESDPDSLAEILAPAFAMLQGKFASATLIDRNLFKYIDILNYFARSAHLIKALIKHSTPKEIKNGKAYQNSLLGLPLGVSCLPKNEFDQYEFFQNPSSANSHEHSMTEKNLSVPLASLVSSMHQFYEKILRCGAETRELLTQWIGNCLDANSGRARIWNSQLPEVYASLHGSDGFFINLLAVLLHFCQPFSKPCFDKLFKINPVYCSSPPSTEAKRNGVHLKTLIKETCLIPRDEPMDPIDPDLTFNFITDCFFLTHYAFRLGFHVVNEKMLKQNQDLVRIQRMYEEIRREGGESSDVGVQLKEKMEKGMTKFLSYRTALLVPQNLDMMLKFQMATASWLVNLCTPEEVNVFTTRKFPPTDVSNVTLSYVPEFIVENIVDFTIFVKRYSVKSFELAGGDLDHFLTMILMLMGSPERVKNPHLRAHLAEMLETLMPDEEHRNTRVPSVNRHNLFKGHLFVGEMIPTLLNVFVSIEMTGQSVAFEQKFQYRRPMYIALEYLWEFEVHKKKMKELADDAEKNMESPRPPVFLHFINLLINDAIFLLDEALTYMSKLRELQHARDSGEWRNLSREQQQQQEGNLHHMGLLAKFHNVMSNETINTLQWLTTQIKSIFCHPTIVERIAAMLNYFLLTLVGPLKKNFKVKDLKEFEFKPQELVRDISQIYYNLGSVETKHAQVFCAAISRDGRSYSSDLFPLAQQVLTKIGSGILAAQLDEISEKVHQEAVKQQKDEELQTGAPDEFLDPIMSTLMKEPVKLPSSGVTMDRATIARHLLSDQTDPFNRSPLTMDMVEPDLELQQRIETWLKERKTK